MKVTFALFRPSLSGGTRVTAIYAERLAKRGHEVSLVFLGPPKPRLGKQIRQLWRPQPAKPALSPFIAKAGVPWKRWDGLEELDARHFPDADVVVATFWRTAYWVAGLPPSKGAKAYFIQHGVFPADDDDPLNRSYALPLAPIAISRSLGRVLETRFGLSSVPVIYNSVDSALFDAPPRERNAAFTVGILYSAAPLKGVADALAALRKANIPNARLVAFGAHTPTPDAPLPPDAEFTLTPPQDDIKNIYARCDAWLCASHAEGFHLPPLEAMACRTPVVSTAVGGPDDIIKDGVNGFIVAPRDVDGLARRLSDLASMRPEQWRALSDAAYATAHAYSWDDATEKFEAALLEIAAARGPRASFTLPAR